MPKHWRIFPHDSGRIAALARSADVSPVVAQVLLARGLDDAERIRDFLDCKFSRLRSPFELPGMTAAVERLTAAIAAGRKITVYGDYDVDGMTAMAVLVPCLKLLGANVAHYVPHRLEEGYGLNAEALETLAGQGTQVVVTVDCGVSAVAQAARAAELGLELIITDHHEFAAELPQATAIVHPRLPGSAYPFGGLSGAGVAFKLAWALCEKTEGAKRVSPRMREFLLGAVGLAALGTVADVVPLVDENRFLVSRGLQELRERPSVGVAALLKVAKLHDKQCLASDDIGFCLAPRLNAAGRLGQAELGVALLTTTDPDRAAELAAYLDELNGNRQTLERSIYLSANKQINEKFDAENDPAFVLADADWHPGVIGIVAGRLCEKYQRPVVMIALDKLGLKPGTGSARSVPGFELHRALESCSQHLLGHGGHAAAAGLKIDERSVDAFRAAFCECAAVQIAAAAGGVELHVDAEVPLNLLTLDAVNQLEKLAPFGNSNPPPVFCAVGLAVDEPPKKIGGGGRHLSLRLSQFRTSIRAVSFGNGEWADELAGVGGPIDVAFRPVINEFRGRRTVELQVTDWRLSAVVGKSS
jgi:single-stranded-DNA-specific exonuclease